MQSVTSSHFRMGFDVAIARSSGRTSKVTDSRRQSAPAASPASKSHGTSERTTRGGCSVHRLVRQVHALALKSRPAQCRSNQKPWQSYRPGRLSLQSTRRSQHRKQRKSPRFFVSFGGFCDAPPNPNARPVLSDDKGQRREPATDDACISARAKRLAPARWIAWFDSLALSVIACEQPPKR